MAITERDEREFREAASLHQAGNLAGAIRAYQKLLRRSPQIPIAVNLLGLAQFQAGELEGAAEQLARALALDPRIPDIHYNLATVLQRLGRFAEALPHFEKALAARPNDADARNNFGTALKSLGRLSEATGEYRKVIVQDPNHAPAHLNLGNALAADGQTAEALAHLERAVALQPRNPDAHVSSGNALVTLGRLEESLPVFEKAIVLKPDAPEPYFHRGGALLALQRYDEAAGHFLRATSLKQDFAEAHVELGNALQKMRKFEEAISHYRTAIGLRPDYAEAWYNLGEAHQALDQFPESLEPSEKAVALKPDFAKAIGNLANAQFNAQKYDLAEQLYQKSLSLDPSSAAVQMNYANMLAQTEREEEALARLDRALAIDPDDETVKSWNMGFFCLGLGRWNPGWELHENRFKRLSKPINYRDYPVPRWDGKKLSGTLMAWGEQGLGDQILWAGALAEARAFAGRMIVECEPRLVPLFARSLEGIEFVPLDEDVLYGKKIDAHVAMASLGRFFRPSWESFPVRPSGYLRADAARASALRETITQNAPRAVGLSWRSVNPFFGEAKTANLSDLEPLLKLDGINFVDLQYGDTSAERAEVKEKIGVDVAPVDGIDNTKDIDGLAALISACDAVVTTSNTTAHIAGALGKHTWVLLPYGRGKLWYWFKDRKDSPWYPNMHLVRQAKGETWPLLAERAAREVSAFLAGRPKAG